MQNILRHLSSLLPSSDRRKLILLTGARQTGKTTLAQTQYKDIRYINLDAPENREAMKAIPSASWGRDIGNAIIDEAQKEPVVFDKIKYAYDAGSVSFSLLLGSSQILLLKKIRESLAGRVAIYELWPLMMSELIEAKDRFPPLLDRLFSSKSLDDIFGRQPAISVDKDDAASLAAENHLLRWGGMPALLPLAEEERWKWLRDYEYTYLERDLSDLARLDDLAPFRKFQKLSALRSGQLLNYSDLARDAAVSVDTSRRYLEYLRISYQVILLQPYQINLTSSAVKTPKIYWMDVGLLRQLTGNRGELSGEVFESMVVAEIHKWLKTMQRQAEIYFYRTRSGMELDLLLETENGFIGAEIKSRPALVSKDLRSLREVARALGRRWRGGLVIYRGQALRKLGSNLWAVPARRLFL